MSGWGLILALIAVGVLISLLWRVDTAVGKEEPNESSEYVEGGRIVSQIAAAQRLRKEAQETTDPEEKARLIRFAEEAEGTAEKVRQGLLSES